MEEFHGAVDHDRYLEWLSNHEDDGYVLQVNQQSDMKLHRASCRKIGAQGAVPPNGEISTTFRKICSTNRKELKDLSTGDCQVCNP